MTATTDRDAEGGTDEQHHPIMDPDEQRSALIRLSLIVGAGILAAALTGVTKTVAVIFAIIVMIALHELGHFATAKWADMKVTEYFLGFGPRLWSIRRGETEYGVKAIPAGAYVKIVGMSNLEEVAPEDEGRTYREKPYWRRLSVAVAGSAMHFLIAFILLWLTFSTIGIEGQTPQLKVGELTLFKNGQSPAQLAGFKLGDKVVSVDGNHFKSWNQLPPYIQAHPNQQLTFVVERNGKQVVLTPTPVDRRTIEIQGGDPVKPTEPSGFIGIGPSFPVLKYGPLSSVARAGGEFGTEVKQTLGALGNLVTFKGMRGYSSQFTGHPQAAPDSNAPRFLSPVGLVRVAGAVAHNGIRDVLRLLIAINIFVGIFNLVPLLPLDGGHVAIATYEKIRSLFRGGRPYHADVAKLMPLTYMVFLLLVGLGLSSVYLDIVHPINLH